MKSLGKEMYSGQQAALCHKEYCNRLVIYGQEVWHLLQRLQLGSSRREVGCTLFSAGHCVGTRPLGSGEAEGDRYTARRPIYSNLPPDTLGESEGELSPPFTCLKGEFS